LPEYRRLNQFTTGGHDADLATFIGAGNDMVIGDQMFAVCYPKARASAHVGGRNHANNGHCA